MEPSVFRVFALTRLYPGFQYQHWIVETEINVQIRQYQKASLEFHYNRCGDANSATPGSAVAIGIRDRFNSWFNRAQLRSQHAIENGVS